MNYIYRPRKSCEAPYLAALYGVSLDIAEGWRIAAAANVGKAKEEFFSKRKLVIRDLYADGGGPNSQDLWDAAGGKSPQTVKGKYLHRALKPVIKAAGYDDKLLNLFRIAPRYELARDLKDLLQACLEVATDAA